MFCSAGQSNRDPGWMAPIIHFGRQPQECRSATPRCSSMPERRQSRAPSGYVVRRSASRSYFTSPTTRGIDQHPQLAGFVFIHTVCAEAIPGCRRAGDLSRLLIQMEQTALANKPDLAMPILDHLADPSNKVPIAVISIMSKCSGRWIEIVEAAVFGAKPKRTAVVLGDALDRGATETVGIARVMKVAGTAFGSGDRICSPQCWWQSTDSRDRPPSDPE